MSCHFVSCHPVFPCVSVLLACVSLLSLILFHVTSFSFILSQFQFISSRLICCGFLLRLTSFFHVSRSIPSFPCCYHFMRLISFHSISFHLVSLNFMHAFAHVISSCSLNAYHFFLNQVDSDDMTGLPPIASVAIASSHLWNSRPAQFGYHLCVMLYHGRLW